MSLVKNIYYTACSALPMAALKKLIPATTFLPYHHTVSDEDLPHISHLYKYKNIRQFRKDLDFLIKNFSPISPDELLYSIHNNRKIPSHSFLLTFDDGFKEVYHIIAPILEEKGIPAIFFINPAFIDNKELFYRSKTSLLIHELVKNQQQDSIIAFFGETLQIKQPTVNNIIQTFKSSKKFTHPVLNRIANKIGLSFDQYLQNEKPFLTTQQVMNLSDRGFTIGAHSWDHPYYPGLTPEEQIEQTISSCDYVQTHFNAENRYFSFPYADAGVKQSFFDELNTKNSGLFFGTQNQKLELNNKTLHRFNAERPELALNKQIHGLMTLMAFRRACNLDNVKRN